jgi:hypothetical protein
VVDERYGMKYIYSLILLLVPLGQHYTLENNTPVWFYIPDELGWTRGKVVYLWGYYPMVSSDNGLKDFKNIVLEIGYE